MYVPLIPADIQTPMATAIPHAQLTARKPPRVPPLRTNCATEPHPKACINYLIMQVSVLQQAVGIIVFVDLFKN